MIKNFFIFLLVLVISLSSFAQSKPIILATTTSTIDSGLLDVLIPIFEKQTGFIVKTIGVGSGLAIEMGRRGEADILLVHSPKDEEKLMKEGFGINRKAVMHNDFILLGPKNDPAAVKSAINIREAFKKIAENRALFISRGDKSGTHAKELSLWPSDSTFSSLWYMESGQGMGTTLMIADQKKAYTLSDRATYLSFKDKIDLDILYQRDDKLFNLYHVIEVNPQKFPKVNSVGAKMFSDFITSTVARKTIANFGKDRFKEALFFPDAK